MATRIPLDRTWFNLSPMLGRDALYQPPAAASKDDVFRLPQFAADSEHDWNELVRDIVALANSGGGRILVPANVADHDVHRWLARFVETAPEITVHSRDESAAATTEIMVRPAPIPLDLNGNFFFRHGENIEPGTTADMRAFLERAIRRVKRRWKRGIRRVLNAPIAETLGDPHTHAVAKHKHDLANLQPVRIVTDPDAPALHPQDVDHLYPWRQKDLLHELNARIGRRALTTYDIQAVRRQHRLDERPEFVFHLPGAGRRYSPALADWIMDEFGRDPEFFHAARTADQAMLRLRRQKPR